MRARSCLAAWFEYVQWKKDLRARYATVAQMRSFVLVQSAWTLWREWYGLSTLITVNR